MRRHAVITLCILLLGTSLSARKMSYQVSSPDGRVCLEATVDGDLSLTLTAGGEVLLQDSRVALRTDRGVFGSGFRIRKAVRRSIDERFATPVYKRSAEKDRCNELRLIGKDGYDLVLRAYDDGVAWRFVYNGKEELTVLSETAAFSLPDNLYAWIPYVRKLGDFSIQFFNTFENTYSRTRVREWEKGRLAFLPVLFETGAWKFCITESDLEHYPGMYLLGDGGTTLRGVFAPYPKTLRQGSHDPSVTIGGHNQVVVDREDYIARLRPGETLPWRVVAVADNDAKLLDNNLVYKLARPTVDADFSWVRPGQVAWDWWNDWNLTGVDFKAGVNDETYRYYIDFAASHGIPYVVLDDGWYDRMAGSAFAVVLEIHLEELISYASARGVGLMLWVGYYVFQKDMEKIIRDYAAMGIKGFKLDAIGRDDQLMNEFYYKAAQLALENKVVLDFHGGAKPAGINRTYPNVLNIEGVHGLEQLKNPNYTCDLVSYDVTFPFIRGICGPADYTQGAMKNATRADYRSVWSEPMSQGTRCRQLAEYIVFESPLCMLCDSPTHYLKEPECTAFITSVPTVWDETKVLEGELGVCATFARKARNGDWYAGSIIGWEAREAVLPLSFLDDGNYEAEIFRDGVNADKNANDYQRVTTRVSGSDTLKIRIAPGGGYAIRFKKI